MTFAEAMLLLTTLGVGGILKSLVDKLIERRRGRLTEEQNAWEQRDHEARWRRILEEALHEHRQVWHTLEGRPYDEMPKWPPRPQR